MTVTAPTPGAGGRRDGSAGRDAATTADPDPAAAPGPTAGTSTAAASTAAASTGTPGTAGTTGAGTTGAAGRSRRWLPSWPTLLLAAVAYIPLLGTAPGRIGADTKAYLYLDPGRLMARAVSMWDPDVGMGTVTHQTIGYLYPQGLWYWLLDTVGLPDWVAQRLWTGTILFVAAAGVLFLLRSFGWADRYAVVAAAGYMLTPYTLEYEARISAILLPYAGLGWLIGITVRGLREARPGRAGWRGLDAWRFPAAFALVVTSVGSINATSLILILLAPLLWVPFAVWGTRETTLGAATGMCARAVLLMIVTSAWWMAGLFTQAGYGLNVLAFTETVKTVASSSQASEVLRGLGNWFFYGEDALGPWITPAVAYTQSLWLIAVSFAVPLLALVAAGLISWGHRAYFVALVVLGTTVSVGVYPYNHPSPVGTVFRDFAEGSTAGLALRSLPRAVPLVVLGLSVLLAGALAAWTERLAARASTRSAAAPRPGTGGGPAARRRMVFRPRPGLAVPTAATAAVLALLALDMSPLFRGQFVESGLDRPENVPDYEAALANYLESQGSSTRVLELPGADFAHYRWGSTLDTVTYGLMDRPTIQRELIPYGEAGSVDLVRSLDRRLQEGVFETDSLADLARLMGVGDVVLRSNNQFERFRGPRPRATWQEFTSPDPAGLTGPRTFGPPISETAAIPYTDEITLGTDPSVPDPPALAVFDVTDPQPIVRTATTSAPLLVSGNGEALVDASASGLLAAPVAQHRTILYTGALADDPAALKQALSDGAELMLSDTNRKRAERWTGIRENFGYTEQVGVAPLVKDPNDNRLPLFPAADSSSQTVAVLHAPGTPAQIAAVTASSYGNTFSYGASDRPVHGIDGDLTTAWRVGAFTDPVGERWQTTLAQPTTTDHIRLVQPLNGPRNRWITKATITFDGGAPVTVDLTDASRTAAGQEVTFPTHRFTTMTIRVDATNFGRQATYDTPSGVGFAEVEIPGSTGTPLTADELLRMPTDLLTAAGAGSLTHPLVLSMSRDRANPAEPFKQDTESKMARTFALPAARTFSLTGTARISAYAADDVIDNLLGRPSGAPVADSSGRLPGDIQARASSVFDGDTRTSWSPGLGPQEGGWVQAASQTPVTFSSLRLSVVADGKHSVPTRLGLEVDGRRVGSVAVPPIADATTAGATTDVTLRFPEITGHTVRFVVDEVRPVTTKDTISSTVMTLPVGLAEIQVPGLAGTGSTAGLARPPATLSGACRTDLMTIDGKPVGLRVSGSTKDAANRSGLDLRTCGAPVALGKGDHVVRTADGAKTGIDLDRLMFASNPGGTTWPNATSIPALDTAPSTGTGTGTTASTTATTGTTASTTASTTATATTANATGRATGTPGPASTGGVPGTAAAVGTAPTVKVTFGGTTNLTAEVSGATPGTPFEFILGQSLSRGWTAHIDGKDLGPASLVDAYANGWRITPTSPTMRIDLAWTPQRIVWAGLATSIVTVVLCLALLGITGRRRRGTGPRFGPPDLPSYDRPFAATPRPSPRHLVPAAFVVGIVGALIASPLAGLVTAAALLVAGVIPRGRLLLRAGSVAALAISTAYVLEVQVRYRLPVNGDWVSEFDKVATLSWLAVLLLGADAVLAGLRGRSARTRGPAPADQGPTGAPAPDTT